MLFSSAQDKKEHLLHLLVREIKDVAIFTLDCDGTILTWNPGARHVFGFNGAEVIGRPLSLIFPSLDSKNKLHMDLQTALDLGQYTHETKIKVKRGKEIWVLCTVTPLWEKNKKLVGFSKLVHNITERKLQEKRQQEFISIASHELKNPLTSIKAYTQLLQLKLAQKQDDELTKIIGKTSMQIDRLMSLIDDLLDVSRINAGSLLYKDEKEISVDDFIAEIVDSIQPSFLQHHIEIQGTTHAHFYADPIRLEQVLTNLLVNAAKYSPEATRISIQLSGTQTTFRIAIQDFGIGLTEEEMQEIFKRFSRTNEAQKMTQGLGLGLFLSNEIITHYHGIIEVESKKGKGSTFTISLPKQQ